MKTTTITTIIERLATAITVPSTGAIIVPDLSVQFPRVTGDWDADYQAADAAGALRWFIGETAVDGQPVYADDKTPVTSGEWGTDVDGGTEIAPDSADYWELNWLDAKVWLSDECRADLAQRLAEWAEIDRQGRLASI